jgi:hypothetical protein
MTLMPEGAAAREGGLGTTEGGQIAVVNAAKTSDATRSQQAVGGEAPADEIGEAAGAESVASPPDTELEVIGGFRVHPLASRFPLIVGKEFDELVEGVRIAGTVAAVELNEGLLIDGRNRVRAVEELRRRGVEIELPTVEWQPTGDETVEGHIFSVNVHRRHLTDDQKAALGIHFLPIIRRSRQKRQAATRFGQGRPAAQICSPPGESVSTERTSRDKDAASTVGQLAAMCNIGMHKARQAVAIADRVEAGEISSIEIVAVATGSKRLRDIVPSKRSSGNGKTASKNSCRPAVETLFDVVSVEDDAPVVTEEEVHRRWERFKQPFAVADHRELRRLLMKKLRAEQQEFDQ